VKTSNCKVVATSFPYLMVHRRIACSIAVLLRPPDFHRHRSG